MPESKPERIAAVVVTYNRKSLLVESLDSLLRQSRPLDGLYIIDNASADGTYETLLDRGWISAAERSADEPAETVRSVALPASSAWQLEVHYIRMPQNTGGAGGFAEGMQRAAAAGFDWLWLMDDDLLTSLDALEMLVRKKDALEASRSEPFILNSLAIARDQPDSEQLAFPLQELSARGGPKVRTYYWRLSQVRGLVKGGLYPWVCPFNGTFIPARITTEIGLPNKDFFIWGDEKDFLWRAARRFKLYTVVDSRVYHPPCRASVFDWRQYYNIRNMMVLNRYFRYRRLRNIKLILVSLVRGVRHGPWGLKLVLRAIRDGLAGRLGKRDDLLS